MWPKAISQLVDLAPHITRLAPLADRFLKDKATGDAATLQAIEAQRLALQAHQASVNDLGTQVRADLGALTAALTTAQTTQTANLATLERQVADFEKNLTSTRADALAVRQATEALEVQLRTFATTQKRSQALAITTIGLLVVVILLLVALFLRVHA